MKVSDLELSIVKHKAKNLNIDGDISISNRKDKRFVITLPTEEKIHFGHPDYDNYIIHKDDERRKRFQSRWKNNPNLKNRKSPLFYSYNLLW